MARNCIGDIERVMVCCSGEGESVVETRVRYIRKSAVTGRIGI